MKKLIIIVLVLVVLAGGGAGALFFLGMPPFKKPAKKPGKAAHQVAKAPAKTSGDAAPAAAPPIQPKAARVPSKTTPTANLDQDERAEARITRLTAVYEQMSADDAGRIFAKLPDPLVEKLLRKMDERRAGKVLLTLDIERAARLTQALAAN